MSFKPQTLLFYGIFVAACASTPSPARKANMGSSISLKDVARLPLPGSTGPTKLSFSKDGKALIYLDAEKHGKARQLFIHDLASNDRKILFSPQNVRSEDALTAEEKLRRERLRETALGVTQYKWCSKKERILIPLGRELWVKDSLESEARLALESKSTIIDPRFSPDSERIAYVQDEEVHVLSLKDGKARTITHGAKEGGVVHGLAEYIAQEEMARYEGFWWTKDSQHIIYTEVDSRHIPLFRINHIGSPKPVFEEHAYPFAGEDNARVKLGVVSRDGGDTTWLDLKMEAEDEYYLVRVLPLSGSEFVVVLEDRRQTRLDVILIDAKTKHQLKLFTEKSDVWINISGMFRPFKNKKWGRFLWASEETGFMHLYRVGEDGQKTAITEGAWLVDGVFGLDEAAGWVYFSGSKDGPTEKHLYRASLENGNIQTLTQKKGQHRGVLSPDKKSLLHVHESLQHPSRYEIRTVGAEEGRALSLPEDARVAELGLNPPEQVELRSRDGALLHGLLYRPEGKGPFPTLISVYGGPHAQLAQNYWRGTVDMRAQYFRGRGYVVLKLDNRGSARRGLEFEKPLKHNMGDIEVRDQVDGVKWLVDQGLADPDRVGVYGWSYGGYMSLLALAKEPEVFKAAVSGAPVTHWDGYDTHYTERYMGLPQENAKGYELSSVMAHLEGMKGKLMLVHGFIDENVHFRHTARLIQAMIDHQKRYELLLFPKERHLPRGAKDREFMEQQVSDFFDQNL